MGVIKVRILFLNVEGFMLLIISSGKSLYSFLMQSITACLTCRAKIALGVLERVGISRINEPIGLNIY